APDKAAVLADARITGLVEKADGAAKNAESQRDWLTANELFYRLNVLLDEQGTYKDDVKRLSHRITLLRIFVPERLWELRNAARQADGKDALPPFNSLGEDYRAKIRGITRDMVQGAIDRAAREHVDHARLNRKDLLVGGLEFIRTMVTTSDLEPVFPAMGDADARRRMTDFLDEKERRLRNLHGKRTDYEHNDSTT